MTRVRNLTARAKASGSAWMQIAQATSAGEWLWVRFAAVAVVRLRPLSAAQEQRSTAFQSASLHDSASSHASANIIRTKGAMSAMARRDSPNTTCRGGVNRYGAGLISSVCGWPLAIARDARGVAGEEVCMVRVVVEFGMATS